MVGYIHYRTVQCEFYVPLNMFKDSKHLTQIIHDIIIAIQDLYDRGILHRDISIANIMIAVDGGGRLIDLDLSRDRHEVGARRSVRTGTWQFMSTRLLTTPGKVHELCDDLESLWFVFLYEGLHFVNHNKPRGIKMASIFDHVDVSLTTGTHTGGLGKIHLYDRNSVLMTRVLDFGNKPFTTLISQIYRLFQTLNAYHTAQDNEEDPDDSIVENVRKLESCVEIKRLLGEALNSEGWPVSCDKVQDQYPPSRRLTPKQKETIALSYVNYSLVPPSEPSGAKRKREEEDDPQVLEAKRPKVIKPLWKRIWSKCTFLFKG
ncbi:hypothetical protein BDM02DRAFT_3264101 [Thelephora ganbajun]|uniref:Uncharacterized protein n=1 Tax=Thelephora ganbajun TaxID=370292 RepID=A0ACB6Z224_THEGA|nr:hypothetical protein BDM02DRAFT_3264101 [Thelephora ganbajun]